MSEQDTNTFVNLEASREAVDKWAAEAVVTISGDVTGGRHGVGVAVVVGAVSPQSAHGETDRLLAAGHGEQTTAATHSWSGVDFRNFILAPSRSCCGREAH